MSKNVVYAIVKAGGRQEKVSVGDIVVMDRISGQPGDSVDMTPVLLVDGDKITSGADDLAMSAARRSMSSSTRTRAVTTAPRVTART